MPAQTKVRPSYLFSAEPSLENYFPKWLDNLADDATLEGSMLDGAIEGAEDVRSVVAAIRAFYDRQAHKFAGPAGDGGLLEEYVAEFRGEPLGCVVLASYNEAGRVQRVVASYRPRTSVVHFARLLAEKFAGTPIAKHFA